MKSARSEIPSKCSEPTLSFSKLHACGNSSIMIHGDEAVFSAEDAQLILDPERGIGGENLLIYREDQSGEFDVLVEGFNRDGTRVGLCGNGARCLTWHLKEQRHPLQEKLQDVNWDRLRMKMDDSSVTTSIISTETRSCSLSIKPPSFDPKDVPCTKESFHGELTVEDHTFEYVVLNVSNPQCILFTETPPDSSHVERIGSLLEKNRELFPDRTNVTFCSILLHDNAMNQLELRFYERGVGVTTSSGTGSAAAAAAAIKVKGLNSPLEILMPGGKQIVNSSPALGELTITTEITEVFQGKLNSDTVRLLSAFSEL